MTAWFSATKAIASSGENWCVGWVEASGRYPSRPKFDWYRYAQPILHLLKVVPFGSVRIGYAKRCSNRMTTESPSFEVPISMNSADDSAGVDILTTAK